MNIAIITLFDRTCPGARSLVAVLEQAGHDVSLIHFKSQETNFIPRTELEGAPELSQDYTFTFLTQPEGNYYLPWPKFVTETEKDLLVDFLKERSIEAVGISTLTMFSNLAADLSGLIHKRLPGVKVLWGGVHVFFAAEESMEHADVACVGEGEDAFLEFAADPSRTDIEGLWFRKNGSIVRNPRRPLRQDLDSFPFASYGHNEFLIEDGQIRQKTLEQTPEYFSACYYISSQRGCPFRCTYCSNSGKRQLFKGEKYLRRRSQEHVFKELEYRLKQIPMETVRFLDDVLLVDAKWIRPFFEEYKDRIGKQFGCYVYPTGNPGKMMEWGIDAGLAYVNFGLQSGSPYVLREVYKRMYSLESISELAWRANELGLELVYDLLCFNPYENETHLRETLDFLLTLPRPSVINAFYLTFFPGSEIMTMGNPRYDDVSQETHLFYTMLFHLIRHPNLSAEMINDISQNPVYRKDPEKLARLATVLVKDTERNVYLERENQVIRMDLEKARQRRPLKQIARSLVNRVISKP